MMAKRYLVVLVMALMSLLQTGQSSTAPPRQLQALDKRSLTSKTGSVSYEIPPFALSFQSKNTLKGDEELDGVLLASTLDEPLRMIVSEFVAEVFQRELAESSARKDVDLPDLVWDFETLELQVDVSYQPVFYGDLNGRRRKLRNDDAKNHHRPISRADVLMFYAEFTGNSYYVEPPDAAALPERDLMYHWLGKWLDAGFSEHLDVLKQRLRNSEAELLQFHQLLIADTHIQVGSSPFYEEGHDSQKKSPAYKALLTVLVVLVCASVMAVFWVARPSWKTMKDPERIFRHAKGAHNADEPPETLPGRHSEAREALHATDEYLAKHHPGFFDIEARPTSPTSSEGSSHHRQIRHDDDSGNLSPEGSNHGDSRNEDALSSCAVDGSSGNGYTPVGTLFKKLVASISGNIRRPSPPPQGDGLMNIRGGGKQSMQNNGDGLVCDEDPSRYSFPFQDFPRQDGTPCLIYDLENEREPYRDDIHIQEREPYHDEKEESSAVAPAEKSASSSEEEKVPETEQLSDDDFKRQLSIHSTVNNTLDLNDSFDEEVGSVAVADDFVEKLERVFSMRRRHYEKETMMNRVRERRQAEARERELKLRRHTMELDLEQIEADLTPRALSRKNSDRIDAAKALQKQRSHRLIASDSTFFSTSNNNLMELEQKKQQQQQQQRQQQTTMPAYIDNRTSQTSGSLNNNSKNHNEDLLMADRLVQASGIGVPPAPTARRVVPEAAMMPPRSPQYPPRQIITHQHKTGSLNVPMISQSRSYTEDDSLGSNGSRGRYSHHSAGELGFVPEIRQSRSAHQQVSIGQRRGRALSSSGSELGFVPDIRQTQSAYVVGSDREISWSPPPHHQPPTPPPPPVVAQPASPRSLNGNSNKMKRQHRHHRRGCSHGSDQFEEMNNNGLGDAHDVMTHGIAAYTDFV